MLLNAYKMSDEKNSTSTHVVAQFTFKDFWAGGAPFVTSSKATSGVNRTPVDAGFVVFLAPTADAMFKMADTLRGTLRIRLNTYTSLTARKNK
jgi:hypothetical protein